LICARIASGLLILHGITEVAGLFALLAPAGTVGQYLTNFGGLRAEEIAANATAIALLGAAWGVIRFFAAWGSWRMRKWGAVLGVAVSLVTLTAAISIFPAGLMDTFLAAPVLILLLYAWFGRESLNSN
jgi:uncharacterized membrane protein (DUF2068 family)